MDDHETSTLSHRVEALLFSEGAPIARSKLMKLLQCDASALSAALDELGARLNGGISLLCTETDAALVVAKEVAPVIEDAYAAEQEKEIGDAGLEVLAIILYKGPSTRAAIDYIRGVNSSFSIRSLLTRGLIERAHNPGDSREFLYRPSAALLAHLGTRTMTELPDHATIASALAAFEKQNEFRSTEPGT